jgi:eukaryotic-like serine/threonine-protein kinase
VSANAYLSQSLKPGDVIGGKYRVEKVIGVGGMGIVLACYHLQLEQRVAIKMLLPEVLDIPEAVARFSREARAAVRIKSEHVAHVTDVGTAENGAPYMVMEYLEGSDLSDWLKQRGALPVKQAIEFVLQASEAIAEAHALGIVHRDLKPANLFCIQRADGGYSIKVLDFGISKITNAQSTDSGLGMTRTSTMMGTPYYMSPEQMRSSRDVDARTDIWALGAILYELLAGALPFTGEQLAELCIQIISNPTPLIRATRPEVPIEVERTICKCLEKEREQRYVNIAEFAAALGPFAPSRARVSVDRIRGIVQGAGMSVSALAAPPSSGSLTPPAAPGQTGVAWGQTSAGRSQRNKWLAVSVLLAMTTLGLGAIWFVRSRVPASRETSAASSRQSPLAVASVTTNMATAMLEARAPASAALEVAVVPSSTTPPVSLQTDAGAPATPPAALANRGKPATEGNSKHTTARSTSIGKDVTPSRKDIPPPPPAEPPKSPPPTAKPNCDPPYTLDDLGRKHFKAECY